MKVSTNQEILLTLAVYKDSIDLLEFKDYAGYKLEILIQNAMEQIQQFNPSVNFERINPIKVRALEHITMVLTDHFDFYKTTISPDSPKGNHSLFSLVQAVISRIIQDFISEVTRILDGK